jgi:hypothetical protein
MGPGRIERLWKLQDLRLVGVNSQLEVAESLFEYSERLLCCRPARTGKLVVVQVSESSEARDALTQPLVYGCQHYFSDDERTVGANRHSGCLSPRRLPQCRVDLIRFLLVCLGVLLAVESPRDRVCVNRLVELRNVSVEKKATPACGRRVKTRPPAPLEN